jgi:arginyl-tRNA synthetase
MLRALLHRRAGPALGARALVTAPRAATAGAGAAATAATGSAAATSGSIVGRLRALFVEASLRAYPAVPGAPPPGSVTRAGPKAAAAGGPPSKAASPGASPPRAVVADYQCNDALGLARLLRADPRVVAQRLVEHLPPSPCVARVAVSGPGFINVTLCDAWLDAAVRAVAASSSSSGAPSAAPVALAPTPVHATTTPAASPGGGAQHRRRRRVLLDFGSPNMGKGLHVGHLRSAVIGDTLARLLRADGHDVTCWSHVGDWGSPMATLITSVLEAKPPPAWAAVPDLTHAAASGVGSALPAVPALPSPAEMSALYETAKRRAAQDDTFAARVRAAGAVMQEWESAPPEMKHVWNVICEASRRSHSRLYARLGVSVTERGESAYRELLAGTVQELVDKGLGVETKGAVGVFIDGADAPPVLVRTSSGAFLYATTDLAALRYRVQQGFDWVIYVTDAGQSEVREPLSSGI